MKYIELFWNRLYYCIFNCDKKTQTLLNRFFECLFYYLKFYRNRKGNNTRIPYNETVGICVSDYIMIGFTCLLIWTLFNLVSILFHIEYRSVGTSFPRCGNIVFASR